MNDHFPILPPQPAQSANPNPSRTCNIPIQQEPKKRKDQVPRSGATINQIAFGCIVLYMIYYIILYNFLCNKLYYTNPVYTGQM